MGYACIVYVGIVQGESNNQASSVDLGHPFQSNSIEYYYQLRSFICSKLNLFNFYVKCTLKTALGNGYNAMKLSQVKREK